MTTSAEGSGPAGLFIVLEGPDGAGKSVQARRLAERLRERGLRVTWTREPGGTPLGEQVRQILLDPADVARGPVADALLFNAARSQLVADVILPALRRGEVVVLDRYATSTLAYQGYGSGVDRETLALIARLATAGLQPDVVVVLDVPVEVGLARRDLGHAEELTRFEDASRHDIAFHQRVRDGYLEMAAADPERWVVIDGSRDVDAVAEDVSRAVDAVVERRSHA
ncbi:MAG TPA: dTMP kinase [Anaerolineae bacterium]|jgi:dTMP kinase|nr:dTMP kinase [Anaerolineae bacterium]